MKGKVTEALAAGLPGGDDLDRSRGARGHRRTGGDDRDDNEGLAERVIDVLSKDELWDSLASHGRELAVAFCSPQGVLQTFAGIINALPDLRSVEHPPRNAGSALTSTDGAAGPGAERV
jgi:hypothetical protein